MLPISIIFFLIFSLSIPFFIFSVLPFFFCVLFKRFFAISDSAKFKTNSGIFTCPLIFCLEEIPLPCMQISFPKGILSFKNTTTLWKQMIVNFSVSVKLFLFLPHTNSSLIKANTWSKWWTNKWKPPMSDILRLRNPEYLMHYCPLVFRIHGKDSSVKLNNKCTFHRDRARADPEKQWPYIHEKGPYIHEKGPFLVLLWLKVLREFKLFGFAMDP